MWKNKRWGLDGAVEEALGGMGDGALGRSISGVIEAFTVNFVSDAVELGFFG